MSIWGQLRGHTEQREMFRRAMERGRLSQAYLFVGADGIGKQLFARRIAQALLCRSPADDVLEACGQCPGCRPFLARAHPDFLYVTCPEGKRELPISLIAGEDDQRGRTGLCHDLAVRPLEGSRKVAIVNEADTMNDASANAFLKTLEEPPDRAVLFLIASNLDAVLPTIRSRCQLVRFASLSNQDIEELLVELELVPSVDEAKFAAGLSDGSLTVARQLIDPELRSMRTSLYSSLASSSFPGMSLAKSLMESVEKISSDTPAQRVNVHWLIRFTVEFYRAALWNLSTSSEASSIQATTAKSSRIPGDISIPEAVHFSKKLGRTDNSVDFLGRAMDRAIDAASYVDQNVGVLLSLESMLDDLSRWTREALK